MKIRVANKRGYEEANEFDCIDIAYPTSTTRRGRVGKGGLCATLQATPIFAVITDMERLRIRKITPKECWRLMGFGDADFEKAAQVNSDTQLYKQAGNSIVVDVLENIFANLLTDYIDKKET